jgi:hypothetical protein
MEMQKMAENIEKVELPSGDCDILSGYQQIANWRGISLGAARSQAKAGDIPVWRIKGRNVVYAFKSEITEHMRGLARKYRERAKIGAASNAGEGGVSVANSNADRGSESENGDNCPMQLRRRVRTH